jgi:hypothetical protein
MAKDSTVQHCGRVFAHTVKKEVIDPVVRSCVNLLRHNGWIVVHLVPPLRDIWLHVVRKSWLCRLQPGVRA